MSDVWIGGARAGCVVVLAWRTCPLVRAGNVTLGIGVGVEDAAGGGRVGPLVPGGMHFQRFYSLLRQERLSLGW